MVWVKGELPCARSGIARRVFHAGMTAGSMPGRTPRRSKALRRPAGEQRLALFPSDDARIAEIDVFDKPLNRLPAPRLS